MRNATLCTSDGPYGRGPHDPAGVRTSPAGCVAFRISHSARSSALAYEPFDPRPPLAVVARERAQVALALLAVLRSHRGRALLHRVGVAVRGLEILGDLPVLVAHACALEEAGLDRRVELDVHQVQQVELV